MPLERSLDTGILRHIRVYGVEATRAVSYIARDRNWSTQTPEITAHTIEAPGTELDLLADLERAILIDSHTERVV